MQILVISRMNRSGYGIIGKLIGIPGVSYADVESIRNRGFGATGRGLHGRRAQMLKDSKRDR